MSQAKVDQHKQEKYNRKNAVKKSKFKTYLSYGCATLAAGALIVYLGYSVGYEAGWIKPEETTTKFVSQVTAEELASSLATSGDPIGFYNKANSNKSEETTATEEATTAKEKETKEKETKEKSTEE